MNVKRFVCFEDDGTIYKISNQPDERFQFLEVDIQEVEDFIIGKLSLLEHKVEFDFIEKKYSIKNTKQIDEDKLMWSFLYEIPTNVPKEKQVILTKNNKNKSWHIMLDDKFESELLDQNISIDLSKYYFSITKKNDPNVLYRLIKFTDGNFVPFSEDFEFDGTPFSVYTTRRFDSYYLEEVDA